MRGRFLFETNRSIFPEGELGDTEILLWEMYYADKEKRRKK